MKQGSWLAIRVFFAVIVTVLVFIFCAFFNFIVQIQDIQKISEEAIRDFEVRESN